MIKTTIAAGTIALTLAGAGLALAQTTPPRDARAFRPSAEDVSAFTDARIAALKAGLKLTAEQEKNWPAVEAAMRELAKERAARMQERFGRMDAHREARRGDGDTPARADAIERLRQGANAMTTRASSQKKLADAAEPLYKSLDDGQKRRFAALLRMGGRHGHGGHQRHGQRRADNRR
jgi:hypothetical protein